MMDWQKNFEKLPYNNVDTRNEGFGSANQRLLQDPSTGVGTNLRPPDQNISGRARPVLNFSIQTGEEFALEFMRERVNPIQHLFPNVYEDPNSVSSYIDLNGVTMISHAGSESAKLSAAENTRGRDFGTQASSSTHEDQNSYLSVRSVPQTSSINNVSRVLHSTTSSEARESSSMKVKFLFSFGGTVLPRPIDGKLRYVGGETRIIQIHKNISWQELRRKTLAIYDQTQVIKYQLPGEDLDALVSVSSEEDLRNMIEECNIQEDEGTYKPRMFLFSANDLEDARLGMGSTGGDSEILYVVAVNGMDAGSRRNSIAFPSDTGNNWEEVLSHNAQRENIQGANKSTDGGIMPPVVSLPSPAPQSSLPIMSSSLGHVTTFPTHQVQQMQHGESSKHPVSSMKPAQVFPLADIKVTTPMPVPLQYGFGSHPSQNLGIAPFQAVPTQHRGVIEEPARGDLYAQNTEVSVKDFKLKRDNSDQKLNEPEKIPTLDKEVSVMELKMKSDGCLQKVNENVELRTAANEKVVPMHQPDGSVPNYISREEVLAANSSQELEPSTLPSKSYRRMHEPMQNPTMLEGANESKYINEDDKVFSSGGPLIPGYGGSDGDIPGYSYHEPSSVPQRAFHSEWLPREPAELNRLSKSNDSFDPQVLTQACSMQSQTITELVDKESEAFMPSQVEHVFKDGRAQFEENVNNWNPGTSAGLKSNFEKTGPRDDEALKPVDDYVVVQGNGKDSSRKINDKGGVGLISQGTSKKHSDVNDGLVQPHAITDNLIGVVSQGESVIGVSKQGDIIIDINDRFPPDFLSDISSQVKLFDNVSGTSPLHVDETGLSLKMENQFVRKDFSLIDQDHLSIPASVANAGGAPIDYSYPPLSTSTAKMPQSDSHINHVDEIQQEKYVVIEPSTMDSQQQYSRTEFQGKETVDQDGVNTRIPDSKYEVKLDQQNTQASITNQSLGDIDIQTLQIIKNEDLEELMELGSGTFGTVYHGKWRGSDVAIKRIKKTCFTGHASQQEKLTLEFWREADMMSKLHHPNVVAFYGVVQDGPGGTLATVTEFMVNGSLRHVLLSKDRHLDRRKRLILAMDAAFGMEYLHSKNIVHFDLKCDNLLVNLKDHSRPICKVGDFGLSKMKRNTLVTGGVRGTLPWMAPELLNGGSNKVSEKVDIFSFGIVLWEILTGEEPYANMHYGAIIGGIVNNTLRPPMPSYCDPDWKLLMEQCWAPDPIARPSFTEIARRLRVMSAAAAQPKQHVNQPINQVANK